MDPSSSQAADWKARLAAELKRDKKKTAILGALAAVAMVLIVRLVVPRAGPQAARAAGDPAGGGNLAAPNAPAGGGEVAAWLARERKSSSSRRHDYLAKMDRTISRDLFKPNLKYFSLIPGRVEKAVPVPTGDGGWFGQVGRRGAGPGHSPAGRRPGPDQHHSGRPAGGGD